jgi:hypothetical protein
MSRSRDANAANMSKFSFKIPSLARPNPNANQSRERDFRAELEASSRKSKEKASLRESRVQEEYKIE